MSIPLWVYDEDLVFNFSEYPYTFFVVVRELLIMCSNHEYIIVSTEVHVYFIACLALCAADEGL